MLYVRYSPGMPRIDPLGDLRFTYLQVADDLTARIAAGEYPRNLPAERDLARQYKVAYATIRRAIKTLRENGLVISVQGLGTFVASPDPARPAIRR